MTGADWLILLGVLAGGLIVIWALSGVLVRALVVRRVARQSLATLVSDWDRPEATDLTWEDPHPKGKYLEIAERLQERPGTWALVLTFDDLRLARNAVNLMNGDGSAWRRGDYEATHRRVRGQHGVYARYTGEESGETNARQ